MQTCPEILPSARLFVGPGHELSGFDRIWVSICGGRHLITGRNGDDIQDLTLLTYILGHAQKVTARYALSHYLNSAYLESATLPSNQYHHTPHPKAALKGDTPLVWTIDFDQNRLFYDRDGMHLVYHFSLPDGKPIRLRHFRPYIPIQLPIKPLMHSAAICSQLSAPPDTIPLQLFDFVYRIVSDYEFNWRINKFTTERYGLQQLANGLLSCFTLNFKAQKIPPKNTSGSSYFCKRPRKENLLRWRAWPSPPVVPTVSLEDTHILFTERIEEAMVLVNEHFASVGLARLVLSNRLGATAQYVVTSIREIQYFRKTHQSASCTPVSSFFNGQDPPSRTGVQWMLSAIHGHAYPLRAPIHDLPVELQEIILDYATDGSVIDRAVYASVLGIEVAFEWKEDTLPLRLCDLSKYRKLDESKSEHQVLFWDDYVGLSYQADDSQNTTQPDGE
ncbi:Nn.00g006620.m01.CDS01 [Neocucurbitaria sp. VM-36]